MIVSLPMYDRAETGAANDRLWSLVRERLGFGPEALDRLGDPWAHWRSSDLLLSQTCGLPYRMELHETVQLIGTPDHGLPDCQPGYYYSVLVARDQIDLNNARLAFNSYDSQSGWAAPKAYAEDHGITFVEGLQTGAHIASAKAVADGRADVAALDVISWAMLDTWDEFAKSLTVVAKTAPTPALPFVTNGHVSVAPIRAAMDDAIAALTPSERAALHLHGLVDVSKETYLAEPLP